MLVGCGSNSPGSAPDGGAGAGGSGAGPGTGGHGGQAAGKGGGGGAVGGASGGAGTGGAATGGTAGGAGAGAGGGGGAAGAGSGGAAGAGGAAGQGGAAGVGATGGAAGAGGTGGGGAIAGSGSGGGGAGGAAGSGSGGAPWATCSPACTGGQVCNGGLCVGSGALSTCQDGIKDLLETGVDCGGGDCAPCATGSCAVNADCLSQQCNQGTCGPAVPSPLIEDFETGNFSRFPWQLAADMTHPWVIENTPGACHGGSYCARSSLLQASGETTSISLSLSVRADSTVGFWAKTDTESGQHFLRFYVDGTKQLELSGQNDWTFYSFPVSATGAGGPDRVLKWEYSRSTYVDATHPPENSIWLDDIDLPAYNTQPTVPRLIAPASGQVVATTQPAFDWRSSDADFDRIIYEVQYDVDPAFSAPVDTGETSALTFTPTTALTTGTTYYWRARAKDVSDYRWGAWSPVSSFEVDTTQQVGLWRQQSGPELALDTFAGAAVAGNAVGVSSTPFTTTGSSSKLGTTNDSITTSGLPFAQPGASAQLQVNGCFYAAQYSTASGACKTTCVNSTASGSVTIDGSSVGTVSAFAPNCACAAFTNNTFTVSNFQQYIASDSAITLNLSTGAGSGCNGIFFTFSNLSYTLTYPTLGTGTVTSTSISLDAFPAGDNWDGLSFDADAGAIVQVLDQNKTLVPDTVIPGNAAGLAPGSVKLWNLAASQYPVIYLRATLNNAQQLRRWEVTANTGYQWDFVHGGDAEGWKASLTGATPTITVSGGVLRMDAPATGTDPQLVYLLPGQVDATRFKTLTVRLRSSNNSGDDTVTLYWQNNYGQFDPVRSFSATAFLYQQTEVPFDLTQIPAAPNQPWQGQINGLRVDPVQSFFDATGAATAGWFEVDWIWLR
ncbi:MAG TPA: hypothetical protein VKZ18_19940 [Polyangia bacterium]|nr:hypothetical protein [Polyangia bacterium]